MRRAVVAAIASLALVGCAGAQEQGDLLIRAERLFDGERVLEPGAVLIRGDDIAAVGEELDADAERTIDLGDATILPGFIDLHVHIYGRSISQILEGGVTTVRDLGAPLELLGAPRDAPLRILAAGPIVTAPGGYPIPVWGEIIALEVRGERRARAAVRELAARGADVIKIAIEPTGGSPILRIEEIRAIVDEAHAHDLEVAAHSASATMPIEGGVDELAHIVCGGASDDILRRMVDRDIEIVATLHVLTGYGCAGGVDMAARFAALGGELLYGSDFGNPGIPPGIDVAELRLLRDAGLTPEQVLAAATSRAGEHVGLEPLGRLEDGAPADVIAVRGDARRLPDGMGRPLLVVRAGRIVVER